MKIDVELAVDSISDVPPLARAADKLGFDALWANETKHDPFLQLTLAASNSRRVKLGTSIALAFTRSPMTLAYTSWDLQSMSNGRFTLGLGTQVKGHIERRFGLRWEPPVDKMKEVILSLRAIWRAWQEEKPLDFKGKFFTIDLMTPFFDPGPISHPAIPIFVAGVNPMMCRLAGELCDGLHIHPLHTVRYLKAVVLRAVEDGLRRSRRKRADVELAASVFVAVGNNHDEIRTAREECRRLISFYGSTRTYRPVLDIHGWGDVCDRLHTKSIRGDWAGMSSEISEEMLDEFIVEGRWEDIGDSVRERYERIVDRVRLYRPFDLSGRWKGVVSSFHA